MFRRTRIRLDPELYARAEAKAHELGYPSAEQFVAHLVERELNGSEKEEERTFQKRLEGLGYL